MYFCNNILYTIITNTDSIMKKETPNNYLAPEVEVISLHLKNPVLIDEVSGGGHNNPGDDPDPLDD